MDNAVLKTEQARPPMAANDEHVQAELGTTETLALLDTSATARTRRRFSALRLPVRDDGFRPFRVF